MTGRHCESEGEFEAWSGRGSGAPLPPELRAHAAGCAECGAFVADVEGLREAFRDLGAPRISEHRFDEMRFALMAEARKAQQQEAPPPALPPRRPLPRWLAFAAAAALLLTGLAWASGQLPALSLWPNAPPPAVEGTGRPHPGSSPTLGSPKGQPDSSGSPSSDEEAHATPSLERPADGFPPDAPVVPPPSPGGPALDGGGRRAVPGRRVTGAGRGYTPVGGRPGGPDSVASRLVFAGLRFGHVPEHALTLDRRTVRGGGPERRGFGG